MSWRYKFKKLTVKLKEKRRSKQKGLELDDFQKHIYNTIINFINDKDSVLISDNIGDCKSIINGDTFIDIVDNYVTIMGSNYIIERFDDRTKNDIIEKFNSKINKKVNGLRLKAKNAIKSNLSDIQPKNI